MLSYCLPFPHFPWVLGTLLCIRANQEPTRLAFSPAHGVGDGGNQGCSTLSPQGLQELMLHL